MKEFYRLLKEKFPHRTDVLTEIINLEAINHLPKGTEHFVSDLHGEYDAFDYLLRNGSGTVREKVAECFTYYRIKGIDIEDFCLYLYYPEEKLAYEAQHLTQEELDAKMVQLLPIQIQVLKYLGNKYTRSKIRKSLPKSFAYIIEELLAEIERNPDKQEYFKAIIHKIASLNQLDDLFIALSEVIQRLVVDHLHVVGDIYDRGPSPDVILERLMALPTVDIQWGNHDITWMGAVSGSTVCMVNVIRIAARYNNLNLIEDAYGINLRKLIDYSRRHYQPVPGFQPNLDGARLTDEECDLLNVVQQATAILQFKLEDQLIERRPDFKLHHRRVLSFIDYEKGVINLAGQTYELVEFNQSVINPEQPNQLTAEERSLLRQLRQSFQTSEVLQRHIDFLFEKGAMYLCYNNKLLFHGCIPLHENGDFKSIKLGGKSYAGRALLDFYEEQIRKSYRHPQQDEDLATDIFWYLWVGESSSLFGKQGMKTFERYYVADKSTHKEEKNAYYQLRNEEQVCIDILKEFGLEADAHIINGHTPVIEKEGENPIKANHKLIVIDGGLAKPYQRKTGIAGYTLVSNSYGMQLIAHRPFTHIDDVLEGGCEIVSMTRLVEEATQRILVKNTNIGQRLSQEILHLEHLYQYYDDY